VAADQTESQELLSRLLTEFAEPIIRSVIKNKLRATRQGTYSGQCANDVGDVYGSINVQLLARLRNLKAHLRDDAIRNFRSYVTATAYNACNEYLRRKYPQRYSLKSRLRYVLTHDRNFIVWGDDEHHLNCSLATWTRQAGDVNSSTRLRELRENPRVLIQELSGVKVPYMELSDLLPVIFNWVSVPIKLDELVAVVGDLLEIKDRPLETFEVDAHLSEAEVLPDVSFATRIEQRERLRHLWSEINQLPPRQRAALLLNLRDTEGRDITGLFPLTGTASVRQLAEAVDIPPDQFAKLWRELPLDDTAIAKRLGATRQQVINLRKAARKRLVRKQKGYR